MRVGAEERGAFMGMRRTSILLLATFVVLTAGCGEEDNTGAPTKADFAAERKALGKGGKALARKSDEKTGRDQGKGKSGDPVAAVHLFEHVDEARRVEPVQLIQRHGGASAAANG